MDNTSEAQTIINNLKLQAQKLAFLLGSSTISEDIKASWMALLPYMSLRQIEKFLNILEAKYLDEQTSDIDAAYKEKMKNIVSDFEKDFSENKEILIKELKQLEKIYEQGNAGI